MILLEQGHVTVWTCVNEVSAGDLVETRSRHVVVLCKRCQYRVILFEQLLILTTLDPVNTYHSGPCWYLWRWTLLILMTLYPADIYGTGSSWYLWHWTQFILMTLDPVDTYDAGPCWYLWHWTHLILMTLYPPDIYGTGSSWYLRHWTQFILICDTVPADSCDTVPSWYLWHWTLLNRATDSFDRIQTYCAFNTSSTAGCFRTLMIMMMWGFMSSDVGLTLIHSRALYWHRPEGPDTDT